MSRSYISSIIESIGWIGSPNKLHACVERVRDVRALGLDVGVDFHGRLHKGMARQLARLLEPYQPLFIEGRPRNLSRYSSVINVIVLQSPCFLHNQKKSRI